MMSQLAFDLSLRRGEFQLNAQGCWATDGVIGLVGSSGAGKSSLLRSLAGLEPHSEGHTQLASDVWLDSAKGIFIPTQQRSVGMVFQRPTLFSHLSVAGNLDYAWRRADERRRMTVQQAADQLGISHLLERQTQNLSGGEAQRVAIARALIPSPRLLMLDEPLASIDAQGRREVMACLERLRAESPVPLLYVSHNLDEVARLADSLVLMDAGRIVAQGPVANLLTRLDLPLAQAPDAEAIIEGQVTAHDDAEQLTHVSSAGGELLLARQNVALGEHIRLRIQARDVSLALSRAADSSILNILPCTVVGITEAEAGQCLVQLALSDGQAPLLLARVTQRSARHLDLRAGLALFAQIKSVALA